jgi:predicted regulator of Ras-like GTPase activity (Roadblock/LC7/MglB family)
MNSEQLREEIGDPSWVLDPITEIGGVMKAVILSADGMQVGKSDSASDDDADRIAAMSSSLQGAARAAAIVSLDAPEDSPASTITVELEAPRKKDSDERKLIGRLTLMPAGKDTNAFIAVAYSPETPMGIIAHAMAKQAKNLGEALMSVSARTADATS